MDTSFGAGVKLQKKIYDKHKMKYIDLSSGLIIDHKNNQIVSRLGKRDIKVLSMLIVNDGKLTTREELMNCAWRGRVVTDNVLNVSISNIRKVFIEFDSESVDLIKTINGLGYFLNLELSSVILDD